MGVGVDRAVVGDGVGMGAGLVAVGVDFGVVVVGVGVGMGAGLVAVGEGVGVAAVGVGASSSQAATRASSPTTKKPSKTRRQGASASITGLTPFRWGKGCGAAVTNGSEA